jgi:hypothetical protein
MLSIAVAVVLLAGDEVAALDEAREAKEAANAYRRAALFFREIARAASLEEMHAALTEWNTEHVGGGTAEMRPGGVSREAHTCRDASGFIGDQWNVATICDERIKVESLPLTGGAIAINSTVVNEEGRALFVGTRPGIYPLADPADLLRLRGSYRASMQQGLAPQLLERGNGHATSTVRHRLEIIAAALAGNPAAQASLAAVKHAAALERANEQAERERAVLEMAASWGYNREMLTPSTARPGWWDVNHARKIVQPWETMGSP